MKKLLTLVLVLVMSSGLFAQFGDVPQTDFYPVADTTHVDRTIGLGYEFNGDYYVGNGTYLDKLFSSGGVITGATGRTATLTVAAVNSNALSIAQADYVCDGTADDDEILTARDDLPAGVEGLVFLFEGTYNTTVPLIFTDKQKLSGMGMYSTIINNGMADVIIEDGEDAWNDETAGSVTCTADAVDFKVGAASAKMAIAGGVGVTTLLSTEVITSADYSARHRIQFWAKSSVATSDGDMQILLDDSPNCASPVKSLDLRAMDAGVWTYHDLDLGDASGLTAIISVGLNQVTDIGAANFWFDDIKSSQYAIMVESAAAPADYVEISDLQVTGSGSGLLLNGARYSTFQNLFFNSLDGAAVGLSGDATYSSTFYDVFNNITATACMFGLYACGEDGWLTNTHVSNAVFYGSTEAAVYFNCYGSGHAFNLCTFENSTTLELFTKSAYVDLIGCRVEGSDIYIGTDGKVGLYGGVRAATTVTGNLNGWNEFRNEVSKVVRNAEFYIAASDADDQCLAQADYVLTGTADDILINACISALPASSGGRIILSGGTVTLADPIVVNRPNVIFQGSGPETLIDGDGLATGEHAISITGNMNNEVRDLSIQTEDGGGKVSHCIYISNAHGTKISRVVFVDSDSDGVHFAGGAVMYGCEVSDCNFTDVDGSAIYCDVAATETITGFKVISNKISSAGTYGIYFGDTGAVDPTNTYLEILGNSITGTGSHSILVEETNHSKINDNTVIDATGDGILIDVGSHYNTINDNIVDNSSQSGIHINRSDQCSITGGVIDSASESGILVDDAHRTTITGVTSSNNSQEGIKISNYSFGCTISGCTVYNNTINGINVENSIKTMITGNTCYENSRNIYIEVSDNCTLTGNSGDDSYTTEGLLIFRSSYCTITGNVFVDNQNEGIRIVGDGTTNSDYNTIVGNTVTGSGTEGIEIDGAGDANGNIVVANKVEGNAGTEFDDGGTGTMVMHDVVAGTWDFGAANLITTGDVGATGSRVTKGWFTDLECTNAPTVSGSAVYYTGGTDVAVADGGTGQSTATLGFDALAPSGASTDDVVRWSGTSWTYGPPSVSGAGSGISFYMEDTEIIGTGNDNDNTVATLSLAPSGAAEHEHDISVVSNTVYGEGYLYDTALGGSTISAGDWEFVTYAGVSSVLGGRESSLSRNIYVVEAGTGTLTITGTGTSRTATASAGTPFAAGDAEAGIDDAGYVQTPNGLYQITGYTSTTVVTVTTPTTYTNEAAVAFGVWKLQFGITTGEITNVSTNYGLYSTCSVQSEISINTTDKLAEIIFGISNNTTTVTFIHDGTERYSHFHTPLTTRHNDLAGLNGGQATEYYHLTSAEYTGSGTGVFARVTSPTFSTSLILADAAYITYDPEPASDLTFSGHSVSMTVGENVAFGNLLYFKSDGKLWKADANAVGTMPGMFVAGATISADAAGVIIISGGSFLRDDSWAWTVGGLIYASATAGGMVQTAPAVAGDQVQAIGIATHADRMYLFASPVLVEVAA